MLGLVPLGLDILAAWIESHGDVPVRAPVRRANSPHPPQQLRIARDEMIWTDAGNRPCSVECINAWHVSRRKRKENHFKHTVFSTDVSHVRVHAASQDMADEPQLREGRPEGALEVSQAIPRPDGLANEEHGGEQEQGRKQKLPVPLGPGKGFGNERHGGLREGRRKEGERKLKKAKGLHEMGEEGCSWAGRSSCPSILSLAGCAKDKAVPLSRARPAMPYWAHAPQRDGNTGGQLDWPWPVPLRTGGLACWLSDRLPACGPSMPVRTEHSPHLPPTTAAHQECSWLASTRVLLQAEAAVPPITPIAIPAACRRKPERRRAWPGGFSRLVGALSHYAHTAGKARNDTKPFYSSCKLLNSKATAFPVLWLFLLARPRLLLRVRDHRLNGLGSLSASIYIIRHVSRRRRICTRAGGGYIRGGRFWKSGASLKINRLTERDRQADSFNSSDSAFEGVSK